MEIIEKQVEKVKEVPADNYGYNYGRRDINGKANAGLNSRYYRYCSWCLGIIWWKKKCQSVGRNRNWEWCRC